MSAYTYSLPLLAAVFDFQRRNPARLRLVGLATDDPINADAHIDLRKRVWKYYSQDERVLMETQTVEAALAEGVPVFTGELKSPGFRALIADWAPDAIVVCVCGQIFDAAIIEAARCGVYNLHPTDLAKGIGAGPTPYEEVAARGDPWSRWTVHRMTVDVDSGPIVGQSPPVRVGDAAGQITGDPRRFYDRMGLPVGAWSGRWSPSSSGATARSPSSTSPGLRTTNCGRPSRHRSTDPAGVRSRRFDHGASLRSPRCSRCSAWRRRSRRASASARSSPWFRSCGAICFGASSRRCGSSRLAGRSSETLRQSAISTHLPKAKPAVRHNRQLT